MPRRIYIPLALPILLTLSGCGYVHVGRLPAPVEPTVIGDDKLMKENADLRLEKKMLQQELSLTRAQGDALRFALENRAAEGDTSSRLVERLADTTRELSQLRSSYSQLQAERIRGYSAGADILALKTKLATTEEQLANSLRIYTQLQEEVTRLRTDVDRTRTENVALGEQVKAITAQNDQAQAALAQLNVDLLAQKNARFVAEQDAETLRAELKTVAPNSSVLAQTRTGAAADARSLVAEQAAETAALKQQLADFRTQVDTLSAERTTLKQQLADSGRPTSADLANIEAKLSTALRSASELSDENTQLKSQLSLLKNGAAGSAGPATLQDQLRDTQAQAAALIEENSRLKARLVGANPVTTSVQIPQVAAPLQSVTTGSLTLTPRAPTATATVPNAVPGVTATLVSSASGGPRTAPRIDAPSGRTHVVSGGDTLAKISAMYYGTPSRWNEILAANREVLGENNNLVIGRTLRIP